MHSASEYLQVKFWHRKLFTFHIFEGFLIRMLAHTLCLILKLYIALEFLGCEIPCKDDEKDAEEGPPEAHTETPNHTFHLILELIHYCC